jgi:hypothetical protein
VATTLDLSNALRIAAELKGADPSELDGHLSADAILLRPEAALVTDAGALRAYLRETLSRTSEKLLPSNLTRLLGSVRLSGLPGGAELDLDGKPIGTSPSTCVHVAELRPGRRLLRISKPGYAPSVVPLDVESGHTVAAQVSMPRVDSTIFDRIRPATIWGSSGLGVLGATFVSFGIYRATSFTNSCIGVGGCGDLGLPRLIQSGNIVGNGGDGPLAIPLGYSLVAAGLAMVATDLFYDEESERPGWLPPLIGLAVGASVYAVSEATLARH